MPLDLIIASLQDHVLRECGAAGNCAAYELRGAGVLVRTRRRAWLFRMPIPSPPRSPGIMAWLPPLRVSPNRAGGLQVLGAIDRGPSQLASTATILMRTSHTRVLRCEL